MSVMDEPVWSTGGMTLTGHNLDKNLSQCYLCPSKMWNWPGIKPWPQRWKAG